MEEWITLIDESDLVAYAPPLTLLDIDSTATLDDVAALMVEGGPKIFAALPKDVKDRLIKGTTQKRSKESEDQRPPKKYWDLVKEEFYIFLCTDDAKYTELRNKFKSSSGVTGATALSMVSAGVGDILGFKAGAIVGLVAVCLYGVVHFGKEAYCRKYYAT